MEAVAEQTQAEVAPDVITEVRKTIFAPNKKGGAPKTWLNRPLRQIIDIQNVLYGLIIGNEVANKDKATIARAYADIEERRRILLGRPLPGQLRPVEKKRRAIPQAEPKPAASLVVAPSPAQQAA